MVRLTVVQGPGVRRTVQLDRGSLSIGKGPSNDLIISAPFVSRSHGQILWNGTKYLYIDLQSTNGSAIRRKEEILPVSEEQKFQVALEDLDQIMLGAKSDPVVLSFQVLPSPEKEAAEASGESLEDLVGNVEKTTMVGSWKTLEQGLSSDVRAIGALYRLTRALTDTKDIDELFQILAEALFDTFPNATHVLLAEVALGPGDAMEQIRLRMARARHKPKQDLGDLPISRSMILRALKEETGILFANAIHETSTIESVMQAHILSGIQVPLQSAQGAPCVLQIDNRAGGESFSQRDLEVLTVFSVLVSRALNLYSHIDFLYRQKQALEAENLRLRLSIRSSPEKKEHIVGVSPAMQEIFRQIEKVADLPTNVLVQGDTGTGKELVARALHYNSRFSKGKFVIQNCAALPDTLLDSELFGHKKGSFTSAVEDKRGLFELADGGTLFLDELSEMALSSQAKLLRVLQDGTFRRIGEEKERECHVRVICATNRNLEQEVSAGRFRRDLFFRLNTLVIKIPPLVERLEDIPVLCAQLLDRISKKLGMRKPEISPRLMALLMKHDYPGNVRELENLLEGMLIQSGGENLDAQHLPQHILEGGSSTSSRKKIPKTYKELKQAKDATVRELEKTFVTHWLEFHGGVVKAAADAGGMNRSQFHQLLSKLGIDPSDFRRRQE